MRVARNQPLVMVVDLDSEVQTLVLVVTMWLL
jgi:hypothetical protein